LSYIGSQQDELNSILDTYESQIKTIFEESNLQQPMQPADKQRENAYSLAENLNSQLDDVNRNLNIMVEEINKMSSAKQISAADEDDVVSVVYILYCNNETTILYFTKHAFFFIRLVRLFKSSTLTYHHCNGLIQTRPLYKARSRKSLKCKERSLEIMNHL
jgi:hypothetical protein